MLPKLLTLCLFITLIQAQKDKSNKDNDEEQCTNLKTFTDSSSNTNTNTESNEKPNVKASKQFTKQSTASKSVPLRPNIILTLFDDLGYHDLGNYDNVARHQCKTPVMDHLMSTGIRLQNFYAMPICSPTRAAIMTGRYPIRYGGNCGTPPGLAAAAAGIIPVDLAAPPLTAASAERSPTWTSGRLSSTAAQCCIMIRGGRISRSTAAIPTRHCW